jgi:hypothetical protein
MASDKNQKRLVFTPTADYEWNQELKELLPEAMDLIQSGLRDTQPQETLLAAMAVVEASYHILAPNLRDLLEECVHRIKGRFACEDFRALAKTASVKR